MSDRPIAQTSLGAVRGTRDGDVLRFANVPYGRFAGRFLPTGSVEAWEDELDATEFGPACPQIYDEAVAGALDAGFDEDCFTLNVWTPAAGDGQRPVMVWIHGGAFSNGSGAEVWYRGARLAASGDMVVVTINYRLGALGWLHLAELGCERFAHSGNLGLLDVIAALEWVRDHIAAFGGDPGNVTIAGQSAGSMLVGLTMLAPQARGLFHKAILQSGVPFTYTPAGATERAQRLLDATGTATPEDLQALDLEVLLAAQATFEPEVFFQDLWRPVADGKLYPSAALQSLVDGEAARVPVMVGYTQDEARMWLQYDAGLGQIGVDDLMDWLTDFSGEASADAIATAYRATRANDNRAATAILGDAFFRMPTGLVADGLGRHQPLYSFLFEWQTVGLEELGAPHSVDTTFLFATGDDPLSFDFSGGRAPSDLTLQTQQAWSAFCHTGDPNHSELPNWPRYDASRPVMVFNRPPRLELDPYGAERRAWGERVPSFYAEGKQLGPMVGLAARRGRATQA